MIFTILLYGVLPLVIFAIVDTFANLKWAVFSALLCAVADIFITYYFSGSWDPGVLVSCVMIALCGYIAIRANNPLFMKLQPVIVSLIFAATLIYFQFFSEPLLQRYAPALRQMLPAEQSSLLDQPAFMEITNRIVNGCILIFGLYAAMVAYTAYRCSTTVWLITKAVGFWVLFGIMAMLMMIHQAS